jgi:hypothetical protein
MLLRAVAKASCLAVLHVAVCVAVTTTVAIRGITWPVELLAAAEEAKKRVPQLIGSHDITLNGAAATTATGTGPVKEGGGRTRQENTHQHMTNISLVRLNTSSFKKK